jgi:hypothetical protein
MFEAAIFGITQQYKKEIESQGNIVSIVTDYGLDDRQARVQVPV